MSDDPHRPVEVAGPGGETHFIPKKYSVTIPISTEQAASGDVLGSAVAQMINRFLNPRPDTPEEIAAREEWEAESQWIVQRVQETHRQQVERAGPLGAAVLQLHAPSEERYARCLGCDFDGMEAESPEFPCRTYRLVVDATPGVTGAPQG